MPPNRQIHHIFKEETKFELVSACELYHNIKEVWEIVGGVKRIQELLNGLEQQSNILRRMNALK